MKKITKKTKKTDKNYTNYLVKHTTCETLQADISQCIHTLSHDIKPSTLAQIRILEHLLNNKNSLSNKQQELLTTSLEACTQQNEILQNLINFLNYETSTRKNYQKINLIEIIKLILKNLDNLSSRKKITLNLVIPDEVFLIECQHEKLTTALYNYIKFVITNAITNSTVCINLKKEKPNYITIKISKELSPSTPDINIINEQNIFNIYNYNQIGIKLEILLANKIIQEHHGFVNSVIMDLYRHLEINLKQHISKKRN